MSVCSGSPSIQECSRRFLGHYRDSLSRAAMGGSPTGREAGEEEWAQVSPSGESGAVDSGGGKEYPVGGIEYFIHSAVHRLLQYRVLYIQPRDSHRGDAGLPQTLTLGMNAVSTVLLPKLLAIQQEGIVHRL